MCVCVREREREREGGRERERGREGEGGREGERGRGRGAVCARARARSGPSLRGKAPGSLANASSRSCSEMGLRMFNRKRHFSCSLNP